MTVGTINKVKTESSSQKEILNMGFLKHVKNSYKSETNH